MSYRKEWMTDDQYKCHELLANVFGGFHHLNHIVKPHGYGIEYNTAQGLSTFDNDKLTLFVLLCHRMCIRGSVESSGPRMVKLVLFKRHSRGGRYWQMHPKIKAVLGPFDKWYRSIHTKPEEGDTDEN